MSFKYGDRLDLAPMMGHWMARAGRELLGDADALVPVPLHWRRLWARRFNQSAMLAKAISESGRAGAAWRTQARAPTPQQVGLSKTERADNVQGAFRVPAEEKAEVAGRRLVLVDDVLTSGATVDTCARALLRAGAAHVDVLVFARVVDARARHHITGAGSRNAQKTTMPLIEIYTTRYCPYCHAAKALLKRRASNSPKSTSAATGSAATK